MSSRPVPCQISGSTRQRGNRQSHKKEGTMIDGLQSGQHSIGVVGCLAIHTATGGDVRVVARIPGSGMPPRIDDAARATTPFQKGGGGRIAKRMPCDGEPSGRGGASSTNSEGAGPLYSARRPHKRLTAGGVAFGLESERTSSIFNELTGRDRSRKYALGSESRGIAAETLTFFVGVAEYCRRSGVSAGWGGRGAPSCRRH
jgi:hypothetical protein